jgi:hypothetical protein
VIKIGLFYAMGIATNKILFQRILVNGVKMLVEVAILPFL